MPPRRSRGAVLRAFPPEHAVGALDCTIRAVGDFHHRLRASIAQQRDLGANNTKAPTEHRRPCDVVARKRRRDRHNPMAKVVQTLCIVGCAVLLRVARQTAALGLIVLRPRRQRGRARINRAHGTRRAELAIVLAVAAIRPCRADLRLGGARRRTQISGRARNACCKRIAIAVRPARARQILRATLGRRVVPGTRGARRGRPDGAVVARWTETRAELRGGAASAICTGLADLRARVDEQRQLGCRRCVEHIECRPGHSRSHTSKTVVADGARNRKQGRVDTRDPLEIRNATRAVVSGRTQIDCNDRTRSDACISSGTRHGAGHAFVGTNRANRTGLACHRAHSIRVRALGTDRAAERTAVASIVSRQALARCLADGTLIAKRTGTASLRRLLAEIALEARQTHLRRSRHGIEMGADSLARRARKPGARFDISGTVHRGRVGAACLGLSWVSSRCCSSGKRIVGLHTGLAEVAWRTELDSHHESFFVAHKACIAEHRIDGAQRRTCVAARAGQTRLLARLVLVGSGRARGHECIRGARAHVSLLAMLRRVVCAVVAVCTSGTRVEEERDRIDARAEDAVVRLDHNAIVPFERLAVRGVALEDIAHNRSHRGVEDLGIVGKRAKPAPEAVCINGAKARDHTVRDQILEIIRHCQLKRARQLPVTHRVAFHRSNTRRTNRLRERVVLERQRSQPRVHKPRVRAIERDVDRIGAHGRHERTYDVCLLLGHHRIHGSVRVRAQTAPDRINRGLQNVRALDEHMARSTSTAEHRLIGGVLGRSRDIDLRRRERKGRAAVHRHTDRELALGLCARGACDLCWRDRDCGLVGPASKATEHLAQIRAKVRTEDRHNSRGALLDGRRRNTRDRNRIDVRKGRRGAVVLPIACRLDFNITNVAKGRRRDRCGQTDNLGCIDGLLACDLQQAPLHLGRLAKQKVAAVQCHLVSTALVAAPRDNTRHSRIVLVLVVRGGRNRRNRLIIHKLDRDRVADIRHRRCALQHRSVKVDRRNHTCRAKVAPRRVSAGAGCRKRKTNRGAAVRRARARRNRDRRKRHEANQHAFLRHLRAAVESHIDLHEACNVRYWRKTFELGARYEIAGNDGSGPHRSSALWGVREHARRGVRRDAPEIRSKQGDLRPSGDAELQRRSHARDARHREHRGRRHSRGERASAVDTESHRNIRHCVPGQGREQLRRKRTHHRGAVRGHRCRGRRPEPSEATQTR
eukprot:comp15395_c0_seq1/m.23343 comp15395_c0_seq1/g.23343  ORF comp15395_c0_seq1/g.23343 comp15395_c0_seq1/m.23343 type:complete len:1215 (+) comp15395_c0_seq1:4441-8085(+)